VHRICPHGPWLVYTSRVGLSAVAAGRYQEEMQELIQMDFEIGGSHVARQCHCDSNWNCTHWCHITACDEAHSRCHDCAGAAFRERIVPHAVLWFTGEAADEDDEYEDDESDEDGEEEGPRRGRDGGRGTRAAGESRGGGGSAHGSGGGAAAEDGEAADGETECKQQ
jgi:hypothetical protein